MEFYNQLFSFQNPGKAAAVVIVLMVAVFTLAEDLDRPRRGMIQLNHEPLIELRKSMGN